jgi:hypothetical protein
MSTQNSTLKLSNFQEEYPPVSCILSSQDLSNIPDWMKEVSRIHLQIDFIFSKEKYLSLDGLTEGEIFDRSVILAEFRASLKSLLVDEKMVKVVKAILLIQEFRRH